MKEVPLYKLKEGEQGVVVSVGTGETDSAEIQELQTEHHRLEPAVQQRLKDLGIVPGTRIRCLYRSPLQDPTAYEIRGAVIALRKEDSAEILVEQDALCPKNEFGKKQMTIALAGNPNVGKSTVFNTLTGLHQHTGNWAGKTVERASGNWKTGRYSIHLVDIPGCYSLDSRSPEEEISRNFLQSDECDGVIVVCDGTCLERNLILALQILQLTPNVAVCINMMDQVRNRGLSVDGEKLSKLLGVPVCTTEAGKGKEMRAALEHLLEEMKWKKRIPAQEQKKTAEELVREAEVIAG